MAGLVSYLRDIERNTNGKLLPAQTCFLAANVLVFLMTILLVDRQGHSLVAPLLIAKQGLVFEGQVWRLLTAAFSHAGPSHLLFNMLGFFFFGNVVERHLGSRDFAIFVLVIAVAANLIHCLIYPSAAVLGFSGVTLAVIVAFGTIAPHSRVYLLLLPIPLKAWLLCTVIVGMDALYLLLETVGNRNSGTAHLVHLVGAGLGFMVIRARPAWRRWLARAGRPRKPRGPSSRATPDPEDQPELDRLLDKVSKHGLPSLTPDERRFLEQYSERRRRSCR